jgi:hypothetical protein
MPATAPTEFERKFARQKRLVRWLAVLLIVAGIVVVAGLKRLPVPVRMMAGLGDIFMGCVLLVLVRQMDLRRK